MMVSGETSPNKLDSTNCLSSCCHWFKMVDHIRLFEALQVDGFVRLEIACLFIFGIDAFVSGVI